jgi:hypothetical protein
VRRNARAPFDSSAPDAFQTISSNRTAAPFPMLLLVVVLVALTVLVAFDAAGDGES